MSQTNPLKGITVSYDMNKQTTQPLPATIDIEAWSTEFDKMAANNIFLSGELYNKFKKLKQ